MGDVFQDHGFADAVLSDAYRTQTRAPLMSTHDTSDSDPQNASVFELCTCVHTGKPDDRVSAAMLSRCASFDTRRSPNGALA